MFRTKVISYLAYRPEIDIEEHQDFRQEDSFRRLVLLLRFDEFGHGNGVSKVSVPVVKAILHRHKIK